MRGIARLSIFALLLCAGLANAEEMRLADPAQEAEARAIMRDIRCVVCEAQSIAESEASLAADLRRFVREGVAAGKSRAEIESYLVARYGDVILFRPPVKGATLLLWAGPFLLLIAGCAMLALNLRRRRRAAPIAELDAEERERLTRYWRDRSAS